MDILRDFLECNNNTFFYFNYDNILVDDDYNKVLDTSKYDSNIICIGTASGYDKVFGDKLPKTVTSIIHSGYRFSPELLIDMEKSNVINYFRYSSNGSVNIFKEIKMLKKC
jgi:hypothetical protein